MNSNIKYLINEYFNNNDLITSSYKELYHPIKYNILYNNICNSYILTETQHILSNFEDFINYVIDNLSDFSEEYEYSGWNYSNKDINIKNLNNVNKDFPIFLKILPFTNNIYAEILNRIDPYTLNDKIFINLYIQNILFNELHIRAALKHELTHVVKMYAKDSFNNMNSKKDTIAIPDTIPALRGVIYRYYDLLYILSPSEQEAHINGTCEYIKNTTNNYTNDYNSIENVIKDTFMYNCLDRFITYMNSLYDDYSFGRYKYILGIGYYLKKHHMFYDTTKYLSKEFLLHYYDGKPLDKKEIEFILSISDDIIVCILKKLTEYKKKLFNAIYYIVSNKNNLSEK